MSSEAGTELPVTELPTTDSPATQPFVIELRGVVLSLGGRKVLNGVNLSVRRGELLAIIGASGGGKSTLLRLISGLSVPDAGVDSGQIEVRGQTAYVFQDDRLLPWRTAARNVALPHELGAGGPLSPAQALQLVGMSSYSDYLPAQLSGGMRSRVALARALAQAGDILLLDEPFAALDALVRERFNAELRHLHEKTGQTTVLVTHSIHEAVLLADRVAVLSGGQVVAVLETGRGTAQAQAVPVPALEVQLRTLLGAGDSTYNWLPPERPHPRLDLWPLLSVALALLLWHLFASRLNAPYLLPTPLQVWQGFISDQATFLGALAITARTAVLGTLLGGLLGMVLGYLLARLPWLERFASPFVVASQSTPIVVLAPLLAFYLGFGVRSAVTVSALSAFYPLMVAMTIGVREVDRRYHELFWTLRASAWARFAHLELPGALPVLLGGLRLSFSLALIGAVVWEFTDSNVKGLGFLVSQAGVYFQKDRQLAALALLVLLGMLFYGLITCLETTLRRRRGQLRED